MSVLCELVLPENFPLSCFCKLLVAKLGREPAKAIFEATKA